MSQQDGSQWQEGAPEARLEGELVDPEVRGLPESERLLSFYDRLRQRMLDAAEGRAGEKGQRAADLLLVVPDVFLLLVRMVLDREVPRGTRNLIGGALLYFLVPMDLLPEAFMGPLGFTDDLLLAAAVLSAAMGPALEPIAERHWSGRPGVRRALGDAAVSARALLGEPILKRIGRLLERRGIDLDETVDRKKAEVR
ncbi:MAG: YkvA family protein [Acidobacteriota bacterium]|nr:YkvA family protein [Acidobacteriota bacterium]